MYQRFFNYLLLFYLFMFSLSTTLRAEGELIWAKSIGGSGFDGGNSIVADSQGRVYVAGEFADTLQLGETTLNSLGGQDIFIAQISDVGQVLWGQRIGGEGHDAVYQVVADHTGQYLYLTGEFSGVSNIASQGERDAFIVQLDANGQLTWAKPLGGQGNDKGFGLAVDSVGNIYVTGEFFQDIDFDTTQTVDNLFSVGEGDIFVAKWNAQGQWLWSRQIGGSAHESSYGIAVDAQDNVYITGQAGTEVLIAKWDTSGRLLWEKRFHGNGGPSSGLSIAADEAVYLTGYFSGQLNLDTISLTSNSIPTTFIAQLNANGQLIWAKALQGSTDSSNIGRRLLVDGQRGLYVAGLFNGSIDFDPDEGVRTRHHTGSFIDVFVSHLDTTGRLLWVQQMALDDENARLLKPLDANFHLGLSLDDNNDHLYLSGAFSGTISLDTAETLTSRGGGDIFINQYNTLPTKPILAVTESSITVTNDVTVLPFPETQVGVPIDKTLTVSNLGNADLTLSNFNLPPGFSLTSAFPEHIAAGESVSLVIQIDAATAGTFSGTVQFNSNDSDHTRFEFNLTGTVNNAVSQIDWAQPAYAANEAQNQVTLVVKRSGSQTGVISVDYATLDSTAKAGEDYVAKQGTLTWLVGDDSDKTINITLLFDGMLEEEESFSVVLSNIIGDAVLATSQATVTIKDAGIDRAGDLQFAAALYAVREDAGVATLGVDRVGGDNGAVTVRYSTLDGSAITGEDYLRAQGLLSWNNGETQRQFIDIPILKDTVTEGEEIVHVNLFDPTGEARLGRPGSALLKVIDSFGQVDTHALPGTIRFSQSTYQVAQVSRNAVLTVQRVDGSQGVVTVQYATEDGSAQAGEDYATQMGSLTWFDDDITQRDIIIPILDSAVTERQLRVNLSQPTGEAQLGIPDSAVLEIVDSLATPTTHLTNPAGVLQFSATRYRVSEDGGSATITVTRTTGSEGVIEVDYRTQDDTAKTSQDYIATEGTFRWLNGETDEKHFNVGLLDNGSIGADKQVRLILSSPTGNAILGKNAQAVLVIEDNDATTLQFASTNYGFDENSREAKIKVTRQGSAIDHVSVQYKTTDGTATAGEDYTTTEGSLIWVSGDKKDKFITIPLHDDRTAEGNETIQLALSGITGSARLGSPSIINVLIFENDTGECELAPVIDCFFNNEGLLEDIIIGKSGTVAGGQLGGEIENGGMIQDVTFLADTHVYGGFDASGTAQQGMIRGTIQGAPEGPAVLRQVNVMAGTRLDNVIISYGTVVDKEVILGDGICFEDNMAIPSVFDLAGLLGHIKTPNLELDAVRLVDDVLCANITGGIVNSMNGLHELRDLDLDLVQNLINGYLEVDIGDLHYAILPVQVQQVLNWQVDQSVPLGITFNPDGSIVFITHSSREVLAYPVVHDPEALSVGLRRFGLDKWEMLSNGNLKVSASNSAIYYSARPDLFSTKIPVPLGVDGMDSPWVENRALVFLGFEDAAGDIRSQWIYPAAADPAALYALTQESVPVLTLEGRLVVHLGSGANKRSYQGILDYQVTPGAVVSDRVQFLDIADINGDGLGDYRIVYPNGDNQVLFRTP